MPKALSEDLRIWVIRAFAAGASARSAGRRLGIGESTATAWVGRWRRTGSGDIAEGSPYSPDLNPIEQMFAKLKTLLRKAAERSIDGLWNAIGQLLDSFPADQGARYLAHAGYGRT